MRTTAFWATCMVIEPALGGGTWRRLCAESRASGAALGDLCGSEFFRNVQRFGRRHLYVRLDSHTLPVRLRDGVDETPERDPHEEMIVDPVRPDGMSAAARGLSDQGRSFEDFQVVAELLPRRERSRRRENEDRLSRELLARHVRKSPPLLGRVPAAIVAVIQVRAFIEQVAA